MSPNRGDLVSNTESEMLVGLFGRELPACGANVSASTGGGRW